MNSKMIFFTLAIFLLSVLANQTSAEEAETSENSARLHMAISEGKQLMATMAQNIFFPMPERAKLLADITISSLDITISDQPQADNPTEENIQEKKNKTQEVMKKIISNLF